uniref:RING-type E3 ubiquitin transferase n=1 Tax=Caenorhabditis tropicalis TaxID=1561998 RepID=A0A1I7U091_9PELO
MGNENSKSYKDIVSTFGNIQIDDETRNMINQPFSGTRPPLQFHFIHGANVVILKNGRMAKRRESFCKGLAFSNRPIDIDENVCLRLCEVGTSWSGVLRFGVTNEDPEQYRDMPVPTFACPDLTTKEGYWAKALPERYSSEGNILHFYVNKDGELFYGINGSQKGMFLTGINVRLPMWLILDIYGNSVGVEIIDASEFRPRRNAPPPPLPTDCLPVPLRPTRNEPVIAVTRPIPSSFSQTSSSRGAAVMPGIHPLRFHYIKGTHITFDTFRNRATRDQAEYSQGYVFTERPIKNNEKVMIQIEQVQRMYEGGLAFGVTCCDPATIRPSELPEDSSDLVEQPQYWVGIKDIALQPKAESILSFWITDTGEVKFEIDTNGPRTVLHVDNSLELYMYFDVYGSTISIKLLGIVNIPRSRSPVGRDSREGSSRNEQPLSIPKRPARMPDGASSSLVAPALPARPPPASHSPLRVNIRDSLEGSSSTPALSSTSRPTIDDLLLLDGFDSRVPPPVAPRSTIAGSASTSRLPVRAASSASVSSPPTCSPPPLPTSFQGNQVGESSAEGDECNICMDAQVNSVLYTCGHMCMCYECARRLLNSKGTCPICRASVQDVIKTYKS